MRSIPLSMNTTPKLTDAKVLRDSQRYPWMFGMIVDRYQEAFLRKASYILHSSDAAEDAVQDTFIKIYKNGPKFKEQKGASFNSWAYKILTNTCYTHATRIATASGRSKSMDFGELDAAGARESSQSEDQISFVHSVLSRLPSHLSKLLSLHFLEEKSYQEIATQEQLSLSAVRSALHRAKKQFKNIAIKMV